MAYQDACERNAIEGKFGEGKRSYGLDLIRARRKQSSETVIAIQILNLNLSKVLRDLPSFFIYILVAKIRDYFTDFQSKNNDEWVVQ
nr:transposase [Salisediminibacterium selenitireducens]